MRLVEGHVDDRDGLLAAVESATAETGATIQAFDARYVVDRIHLERAVELARRAFERGENVADERAVEILLFAAGRRQIDRALEMGVSEGGGPVVVVVAGDDSADEDRAADLVEVAIAAGETLGVAADSERIREFFDVGEAELAATDGSLADVVHERVALLVVER